MSAFGGKADVIELAVLGHHHYIYRTLQYCLYIGVGACGFVVVGLPKVLDGLKSQVRYWM